MIINIGQNLLGQHEKKWVYFGHHTDPILYKNTDFSEILPGGVRHSTSYIYLLWRNVISACLFNEVKQQWSTLLLRWVTASVDYSCI